MSDDDRRTHGHWNGYAHTEKKFNNMLVFLYYGFLYKKNKWELFTFSYTYLNPGKYLLNWIINWIIKILLWFFF